MNASFETLLNNARAANSAEAIYAQVKEANAKFQSNIRKLQFMSMQNNGNAMVAEEYFQNRVPAWKAAVDEINAIWTRAVSGRSTEEIVAIMTEERRAA